MNGETILRFCSGYAITTPNYTIEQVHALAPDERALKAGKGQAVSRKWSERGAPAYDHNVAAALAQFGVPALACTPDLFPDLMAAAINLSDLTQWAAGEDIAIAQPSGRA